MGELTAVHNSKEAASLNLGYPMDDRCGTLELQSGECLTFNFGHEEACERFILCMRILLKKKRSRFTAQSLGGKGIKRQQKPSSRDSSAKSNDDAQSVFSGAAADPPDGS